LALRHAQEFKAERAANFGLLSVARNRVGVGEVLRSIAFDREQYVRLARSVTQNWGWAGYAMRHGIARAGRSFYKRSAEVGNEQHTVCEG